MDLTKIYLLLSDKWCPMIYCTHSEYVKVHTYNGKFSRSTPHKYEKKNSSWAKIFIDKYDDYPSMYNPPFISRKEQG